MPRFAVVEHDFPSLHWDFFLEDGPALRSWRLLNRPDTEGPVTAEPAPLHRLAYLDYEGPVSGGRGHVTRFDAGTFTWVVDEPGRVVVRLEGQILAGQAEFLDDAESSWTFQFKASGAA